MKNFFYTVSINRLGDLEKVTKISFKHDLLGDSVAWFACFVVVDGDDN